MLNFLQSERKKNLFYLRPSWNGGEFNGNGDDMYSKMFTSTEPLQTSTLDQSQIMDYQVSHMKEYPYNTGTQSFINTLSYLFVQKLWVLVLLGLLVETFQAIILTYRGDIFVIINRDVYHSIVHCLIP